MRILLAVHQFLPEFRAGTETLTLRTGQELQRRGHRVWVLTGSQTPATAPQLERDTQDGLAVIRLRAPDPPSPLRGGLEQSYRRDDLRPCFQTVLASVRPDLVHVFHLRRLTLSLVDVLEQQRVPAVASLTDYWMGCLTGQLQFPEATPCPGPDPGSVNCLRHAAAKIHAPLGKLPRPLWSLMAWALGQSGKGGLARSIRQLQRRPGTMRAALDHFDRVLVPSQLMADTFARMGFAMTNVGVCPYGIDDSGLAGLPPRRPWPGGQERPLRVSFIGTLNPAKGAHVLVEALAQLGPHHPLQVRLYGSRDEHPGYGRQLAQQVSQLQQASRREGAGHGLTVEWAGVFPPDTIFEVLAGTDLLVIPSLWRENSPLILLQALASGLPVLASDVEGMADQLLPGWNSALFPPGDIQQLAGWLERFLTDPQTLAQLCGHGGSTRTVADYVDQLEREYGLSLEGKFDTPPPLLPP
jgi:glycosyltransferase involved in cell wall biosynthesis